MSLTPYLHLEPGSLRDAPGGAILDLPATSRSHLEKVLRLKAGAKVVVADGEGREAAALLGVGTVVIDGPVVEHPRHDRGLHLVQGLAKGRKTDDIVRSATELGVDSITIVISQRSVTKVAPDKAERMTRRWRDVARAAAEQARRPRLPHIRGPIGLDELVSSWPEGVAGVIGHPAADLTLRKGLASVQVPQGGELLAVVGAEGGWTDAELAQLQSAGLRAVTLGPSVLRTEHAGHALCAVLAFYLDRMG